MAMDILVQLEMVQLQWDMQLVVLWMHLEMVHMLKVLLHRH